MRSPDKRLSKITHLSNHNIALNFVGLLFLLGLSGLLILTNPAHAQQQCTSTPALSGYKDYDFSGGGVTSEPTEEKPESKLWYNDGFWWGVMWEPVNDVYTIHRLDLTNQCWAHVGPNVDDRARSAHDVLWDGNSQKLYVSSRAKLSIQATQSEEARLYRYSYNSGTQTYSLDSGFPAVINGAKKTRAMVIAKDSNGKMWVTWTENRKVMINVTDGNDANWGTAFVLPAQQNDLEILADSTTGDISSIVAFGGNKVGVVWGNQNPNLSQNDRKYFFAVHNDSDADLFWQPREDMLPTLVGQGDNSPVADDHISLASPANDPSHNALVFASLKLGLTGSANPRIVVARRDASGNWSHAAFGLGADDHTRPIEVLDSQADSIFVFARSVDGDGIFFKASHFDNLTFPSGFGAPFIRSENRPDVNNPTSTKHTVDASSGMVVLASDKDSKFYMHNYMIAGNSTPIAVDDNATAHKDAAAVIDVTANDTDSDGTIDLSTVAVVVGPLNGTATVNGSTGEITFTPNASYVGPDTLKYTVKDNDGVSADAGTVVINVNDTPLAVADSTTTPQATPSVIDVVANDTDSDGTIDPTTVSVASAPSNGSTSVNAATGAVTYTPDGGFSGFDSFTYTVEDNDGGGSNSATVTVNVNDPPVAQNDSESTNEDTPVGITVLSNDSDGDGTVDPTTVVVTSGPASGSTSVDGSTGEITYTPSLDFSGPDSFTYTVNDNDGVSSNQATVDVTVAALNDNPIAADDNTTTNTGTALVIDVLANDSDVDGTVDPTTVAVTGAPGSGSTSVNGTTGEITYSPNGGFSGNDSFTYTVNDNTGATSNTATVTVNVNDPPLAEDDSASTPEDITVVIDVLANDSDSDGTILPGTVSVSVSPNNGSTTVDGTTGEITYTPSANFFGSDTLVYTVLDDDSIASNAATVLLTVSDVNDAPVATDDVTSTDEGNSIVIAVLTNDSDVDGTLDPATVLVVSGPSNGTTSVNTATGEITYTPTGGFAGNDSFTYTVRDNDGATSNVATISVSTNDRPVAVDDNAVTAEDTPVTIAVLSNDSDSDGSLIVNSLTLVSSPAGGTASVDSSSGQVTYTPFTNFFGTDSFGYTISDNDGATSDTATVTVTINDVNDTPVAVNDVTSTVEDTTIVISVLGNDSDVDGTLDPSTVLIGSGPNNGTATVNSSTGDISYTPNSGFAGSDTMTYTVRDDDAALSNVASLIVTVGGVNFPPTALDDDAFTPEDTTVVISLLSNDSDVDGTIDTGSVTVVTAPSNGTAEVIDNGQITLTFNVTDDAYVNANQPTRNFGSELLIQARTSTELLERNSYLKFNVTGLAGTVVDAKVKLFAIDATASGGSMYLVSNDFEGTSTPWDEDAINFSNAPSTPATPLATLGAVDVGEIVEFDVTAGIAGNGTVSFGLKSEISDAAKYQSKETATPPQLVITFSVPANTGDVLYTPNPNFVGSDSFTYRMQDNEGATSNTATVNISVSDENENPVATNDQATTNEDTPVAISVVGNDTDIDGNVVPTTVAVVGAPGNGTAVVDESTGIITYTPAADFFGTDTFAYTVRDDVGAVSNAATVTVTVTDVNDAPRVQNDSTATGEDQPVVINVLLNDVDVDGTIDTTTVTLVSLPDNGSATVNTITGSITYTPNANFFGPDSLNYTVRDEDGGISDPAFVMINVGASNDPPIVADDAASVPEDSSVVITVLANDTDIDGTIDSTSVTIVRNPDNGTVTVDGTTGTVTYYPALNFFGTDSFTYTVADNNTAVSSEATVTVTVSNENEIPVAVDDALSVAEDTVTPLAVLANDADVDGTLVVGTVTVVNDADNGTTSVNTTTGEIIYTPNTNFSGSDLLTYTVQDDDGATSNAGTVTITVTPENDPPLAVDDSVTTIEEGPIDIDITANDFDLENNIDSRTISATAASNGTTTILPGGLVRYTPIVDFVGTDSFTYTVRDSMGLTSNSATVTITVTPINDAPVAVNDVVQTNENAPVVIDVLANDTDVDSPIDSLVVAISTSPSNGTASVNPSTGEITYVPDDSFSGTDSFNYICTDDSSATSNQATVAVVVNDQPVANDDDVVTPEDTPLDIDVLANDTDSNGTIDSTTVIILSGPNNGIATVDAATGIVGYTPNTNFFGLDTFTYTVNDDQGATSPAATVTITVNKLPFAIAESGSTDEDTPVAINVSENDVDLDGAIEPSTVTIVANPTSGAVVVDSSTGVVTYSPNPDYFGDDSFSYTIADDDSGTSNAATVSLTINPINDAAVAVDDTASTNEETPVVVSVASNDTDVDGTVDVTSVTIVSSPTSGSATIDPATGNITYTPIQDFVGADSVTYTIADDNAAVSNIAKVTINVGDVNDAPVAVDDAVSTQEDSTVVIAVTANDSDIDGVVVDSTVTVLATPTNGTTQVNASTGTVTYTPTADFFGTDSFTYQVSDEDGAASSPATVSVTVGDVNDNPVAQNDSATTVEDNPVVIAVLSNDSDLDGNLVPSSVTIGLAPNDGTAQIDATNGDITYSPNANFFGTDTLTYTVTDDDGGVSNVATVTVTVGDLNDNPVASDDITGTGEDTLVVIDVLANDSDVDGTIVPATLAVASGPSNGSVVVDGTVGTISYTPDLNFFGLDSLTYTISDDDGGVSNTATVRITVTDVNDPPVAAFDTTSTEEDALVVVSVLGNDSDVDGTLNPASVAVVGAPSNGQTSVDQVAGTVTYTPNADFFGTDSLDYTVADDDGDVSNVATVIVSVGDINDNPVASDDSGSTTEDTQVVISVLSNDSDLDGALDPSSVTIVTQPVSGSALVDPALGTIAYTPDANFFGVDSLAYTVADDDAGVSNSATVTVTIGDVNDNPVAANDSTGTLEDTPVVISVLANDSDLDGTLDPASLAVLSLPGNGTTQIDGVAGTVTYTPNSNFFGLDTFTYTISDDDGGVSNEATITVTIGDVNDNPVAVDDSSNTSEDTPVVVSVLANDSDSDGDLDPSSVVVATQPSNGQVVVDGSAGTITYTPNLNFFGADSFTYTVSDDDGGVSNSASITISVGDINDDPIAVDDAGATEEETPVVITVLANDSDLDGALNPASVTVVSAPSNGTTQVDGTLGTITYAPDADFFGADTLTYTVADDDGATSNPANVVVTVSDINDAPLPVNDSASTSEETPVVISVLTNDSDLEGTLDPASVTVVTPPTKGSATVDGSTGTVTYTPNADFFGTDSLTYTVADDDGAVSNAATVTITVSDVNDPPVAANDSTTTAEETPVVIAVLSNDSDLEGTLDPATLTTVSAPSNGTTQVDGTAGTITYSPNANFFGIDSFTYTVADDDAATSNAAMVSVTVSDVNDAPVATDDVATTPEDSSVAVAVLANDSDLEGALDPASITVVNAPTNGTATVDTVAGRVIYSPSLNFFGTDSLTYRAADDDGALTNDATVTLTVTPVNDPPVAADDAVGTGEDQPVTIVVLFNDSDVDGTIVSSTLTIVSQPTNGTTQVDQVTGEIRYSPNLNFNGFDTFTYTVNDNSGGTSNTATVNVVVSDLNDAPVAVNDFTSTGEDTAVTISVLDNDSDADGTLQPGSVTIVSDVSNGSTSVDPATGSITYTPNSNFFGTDSLTYTVSDDDGGVSNLGTLVVSVTDENDLPVATDDAATTSEDIAVVVPVLANDTDVDGTLQSASVTIVVDVSNGTTSVDPGTGSVTYTPNSNFFGTESFTYTVTDDDGGVSNVATATVTIGDVNDRPVAGNDSSSTSEDMPVAISVLNNDIDSDGTLDPASVSVVDPPVNGNTQVDGATGVITYTPNPNFFGLDTFTYTVADDDGDLSNAATVVVDVGDTNDNPVAANDSSSTTEDTPIVISVLANDSDLDGALNPSSVTVVTPLVNGSAVVDPVLGTIAYSPNANFFGVDSLAYTVADDDGGVSNVAQVTITVDDINDTPLAANDSSGTTEDTSVIMSVLANDSDLDGTLVPGSLTVVSSPGNGTTQVDGVAGTVTYTPNPNFFGLDTFSYTIEDDDGGVSNEATATVTVGDVNDNPVAVNDSSSTSEDTPVVVTVLANDSDSDGALDPASVLVVTPPSNGQVTVDGSAGTITYTPNQNFFGSDAFSYTVADDDGGVSDSASVTVSIGDVNDEPVAVDDVGATTEETPVVMSVLANDSDIDGALNPASVTIVDAPSNGTAQVDVTLGTVTYTPNTDFFGTDTLTYTVTDDDAATSNAAAVVITVSDINDAAVAVNDSASTQEETPVVISVLTNDSDLEGTLDPTSVAVVSSPTNGSTTVDGTTGTITYTPNADFFGTDSLTYTVADDDGGVSNAATVTVTVSDVNDAPVAVSDSTTTAEETPVVIAVLSNDSDLEGTLDPATITVVTPPSNGATQVDGAAGTVTYTPNDNFFGTDTFTYTVADDDAAISNVATVIVTVSDVNDAPVASDDVATTLEDSSVAVAVLTNDSDLEGDLNPASVTVLSAPANGTTTVDTSAGTVIYLPNLHFFGNDSFTYRAADDAGASTNEATVTLTVTPVNDPPVTANDAVGTGEDQPVTIVVLFNDSDVDGTLVPSTVTVVVQPTNGTTQVDQITGEIRYSPNQNFNGLETFTYTVNDNNGATSNAATVNVVVSEANDAPVAGNDSTSTEEDTPVAISVLANDSDVDGPIDSSSVAILTGPANGSTSVDATTGEVTYSPNLNFFGTDSFTYTVSDLGGGISSPGTVTVSVQDVNDAPVASNDTTNTAEDTPVSISVLLNDSDVDGILDPGSVLIVTDVSNGSTAVDLTTGTVTFTPSTNFFGTDSFTYTVADDDGAVSNTATVTVAVLDDNDVPVATADSATTAEDTSVVVAVLANDSDIDGSLEPATVTVVGAASNGSTTVDATSGTVTYSPNANFFGTDSFTYTVSDDDGGISNIATVSIDVADVNDAPVAANDSSGTAEDTPVVIGVLSNDTDVDGTLAPTSVAVVTDATNGSTSVDGTTGSIMYTPNANFFGTDGFTYTVADDDGGVSNVASVTVSVNDNNDLPVAVNDSSATDEDTPVTVSVILNDSDLDGTLQPGSVTVVGNPGNGSVAVDGSSGDVTYSPNLNFFGVDTFTYTVVDDDGGTSNVATVLVTVADVNDAPVAANDSSGTNEDTAVAIGVLSNDSDVDGTLQAATVVVTASPANGSVAVDTSNGSITYTPNNNFFGLDTFSYTVLDDDGAVSNVASATVNVSDNNDLPVAVGDTTSTPEDSSVVVQVTANDSDVDGTIIPSTVAVVGAPTNGTASAQPDGSILYTPNTNFFGADSFTYTVADEDNGTSNVASVAVSVTDVNDAPVAVDDATTTSEDGQVSISVLDNDSDVDGSLQAGTVAVVSAPTNGSTTVEGATGAITYTPNPNFTGIDSFSYTINDDDGGVSNPATVVVSVESVNDAPVAVNDTTSTAEETPVTISVLANDDDLDGTLLAISLTVIRAAGNGVTQIDGANGSISYTPALDFFGTDSFTYRVSDNNGGTSNEATVLVTVNPIDDPPVASDDDAATNEDTPIVIPVVANDADVDGTIDPATVTIGTPPSNGTTAIDISTGSVTYTPNLNFFGPDVFTYTVQDQQGVTTNEAAVNVSVAAVNDPPVAVADTSFTLENTQVAINVASNDIDVDFNLDFSSITIVTPPINGTTSVNGITGVVTYAPSTDYNGVDSFSYRISDTGGGTSNVVSVNLTVHPSTLTFTAIEDAYVLSSQASNNFGDSSNLRMRLTATAITLSYMKFDISGVVGQVVDAKVRLTTIDEGADGGGIVPVSDNYLATNTPWDEAGLNFSNAPDAFADPISSVGAMALGQVAEYNVTSAINGNGIHSFAIRNQSSDAVHFSSKEGTVAPELTIQLALPSSTDPTLLTFSPTSGGIGTQVTITGINLSGIHTVAFNGTNTGNFNVTSDNQILATVPSGATTGKVSIGGTAGSDASANNFTVVTPPSVSSFSPSSGPVGSEITITGNGFGGVSQVTFNGTNSVNFDVDSPNQIRAFVPNGASTGKVGVTNSAGSATSAADFTVTVLPAIASFSPSLGGVGTEVTLTGSNFTGVTSVAFNGTASGVFQADSDAQLRANVPAGATSGQISVSNPAGTGTSTSSFTVFLPPTISSFSPTSGIAGSEVTVNGTDFTGTTVITFNGVSANVFAVDSPNVIRANVPASATTGSIGVTNPAGTATSIGDFSVTIPTGGSTFTFNPIEDSFVRDTEPTNTYGSSSELRVRKSSTDYDTYLKFEVSGVFGTVQSALIRLEVIDAGDFGGDIFLTSTNFLGTGTPWTEADLADMNRPEFIGLALDSKGAVSFGEIVEFDVKAAVSGNGTFSFAISNDHFNTVKYSSREGVRSPELVITTGSGGSSNAPSVTSFSPASGAVGTEVTVSGTDLSGVTAVLFNGTVSSSVNVDSDSQVRATVANGTTTGPISVSNSIGTGTSSSSFTVTAAPSVASFTPSSGIAGTQVTVTGANLTGAIAVSFGGTAATVFNVDSDNQLTATAPAGGSTGPITVTTGSGTGASSSDFVYVSAPTITTFSPNSGFVGTEVTLTGSGLSGATSVTFSGAVAGVFNIDSDNQLRATVPNGATTGVLSVTNAAGTGTSSADFTVETAGSGGTFTFNPTDDSFVRSTDVAKNYGSDDELRVRKSSTDYDSYFKFVVSGISGQVQSAFLRLEVVDAGTESGDIHVASNNLLGTSIPWTEEILVFSNAPGITGSPLDSKGAVTFGEIVEFDVTVAISDNGTYSFAISNDHFNTVKYSSKEGIRAPELVITTGSGGPSNLPSVTSFSPTSGSAGTQLTVTGTNLTDATGVSFNGTAASVFNVASANQLTVTAPIGGTTGPISVTTNSGTGSSSSDFVYLSAPIISSFSPTSGPVGSEVTVAGSGFAASTSVSFNGTVATVFNVDSDSQLRASVPSGASTGAISVTSAAGSGVSSGDFTVETGGGGSSVTFTPTDDAQVKQESPTKNYATKTSFKLDADPVFASYVKFSVSGLTAAVQGAVLRLQVLNGSDDGGAIYAVSNSFVGTSTPWNEDELTFSTAPAISGSPFSSVGPVDLGTVDIDVSSVVTGNGTYSFGLSTASNNLVEYSSKEGAIPPQLIITIDSGGSLNLPEITSFNPVTGPIGTELTITGSNFTGASAVSFNGTSATVFSVDSDTQISATVPSGTTSGPISVTNGDGTGSSANDFTLFEPPVFTTFGPSSGPVGTEVTITGSNFSGLTNVSFNGTTAPGFDLDSDTQVRATVPSGASTGKISLTNAAGTTASTADFTVTTGPVISSFTPILGVVGTQVTISGTNFSGTTEVLFNGVTAPGFSVDSEAQITVSVPTGASSGLISVTTGDGSAASADEFTVVVAPTLSSFSPASGPVGSEVTLTGSGFFGTTDVAFNGASAVSFVVDSDSRINVTVPTGATTGTIVVTNPAGTATSVGDFTVTTPSSETVSLNPTDDAFVRSTRPDNNYSGDDELRVRRSSTDYDSYLKFSVSGLSAPVTSAVLRLEVIDAGSQGGEIYSVSNNLKDSTAAWTEDNLTFNLAPALPSTPLETKGAVALAEIVEFDLTTVVTGNGTYSFALSNDHSDAVKYSSKDGIRAPELVITTGLTKRSTEGEDLTDRTEAELSEDVLPQNPTLYPNFPNPFNIETSISYALPAAAKVKLTIYNLRGQLVRVLVDENQKPGIKKVIWDGMNSNNRVVGTGVYFIRLKIGEHRLSRKITLQK